MVKFIVEVSEGYIQERGDMNNLMELSKDKDKNPLALMADFMVFSAIKRMVEEGKTEFKISSLELGENGLHLFNSAVSYLGALSIKSVED